MVKIKRKVEMNLPQLIEWAWENDVKSAKFRSDKGRPIDFTFDGEVLIGYSFNKNDTFTVEELVEITEDTVIPELVELYEDFLESNETLKHENRSISEAKDEDACVSQAFYIINDDLSLTLIWTREKGLVE